MARQSKASKNKKSDKVSVNFKGVETRIMLPENDYLLSVHSLATEDESVKVGLTVMSGKFEGKKVYEYFSLKPTALWRFGNFIAACGLEVPDDEVELDASDFADVTVMGVCTHEEYNEKTKMRWDFYGADEADADASDDDEDADEDDKKSKKSDKKSSKKAKEIEKVSADTVNEADEDELAEIVENSGIDCDLDDIKGIKKKRAAVIEALTEADLLEDEDGGEEDADEDDEKGKKTKVEEVKKASGKKGKVKKIDGSEVEDMDEDALGELIEEHELEVDLDDHKTLRKKVRAVLDALEEKGLLEE